jgi:hypothetical protein
MQMLRSLTSIPAPYILQPIMDSLGGVQVVLPRGFDLMLTAETLPKVSSKRTSVRS